MPQIKFEAYCSECNTELKWHTDEDGIMSSDGSVIWMRFKPCETCMTAKAVKLLKDFADLQEKEKK